jgi:hypothetical protein
MKRAIPLVLTVAILTMTPRVARAVDTTDRIPALIEQLGSSDFARREAAMKALRAIGKPALPALKEAQKNHPDAEVVSRAGVLIRRIEIPPLPQADPTQPRVQRVRISAVNGKRVLDVTESGRNIKITEGDDGIVMSVTGRRDGQRVTEEYTAKSADALKEENPEAYALYEQYTNGAGGFIFRGQGIGAIQGNVQINNMVLPFQPPAADELDLLRVRLEKQMRLNKLEEAKRDEVIQELEKVTAARAAAGTDMEKYTQQCDELRKLLESNKLDAGELLPPPAKTRLGVSIGTDGTTLTVQRIAEKSRAERLGLKEGDEIRKIDGKEVTTVAELRKLVSAKEKGLSVEITRDGEEMKLEEKEEAK